MIVTLKAISENSGVYESFLDSNLSQINLIEFFNDVICEFLGITPPVNRKIYGCGEVKGYGILGLVHSNGNNKYSDTYTIDDNHKLRYYKYDDESSNRTMKLEIYTNNSWYGYTIQFSINYHIVDFDKIFDNVSFYIWDWGLGGQSFDLGEHFSVDSCKFVPFLSSRQVIKYYDVNSELHNTEMFVGDMVECSTFNIQSNYYYDVPLIRNLDGFNFPQPDFKLEYDFGTGEDTYTYYYQNTNCKIKFVKLISGTTMPNVYVDCENELPDLYNPMLCSSVEPFFNVNCTPDGAVDCSSGQVLANQLNNLLNYLNDNVFNGKSEESEEMDYTIQLNSIAQSLQDIHNDLTANVLVDEEQQTINITQAVVNNSEVLYDKELTVINNLDYSDRISSKPKTSGYPDDDLLI